MAGTRSFLSIPDLEIPSDSSGGLDEDIWGDLSCPVQSKAQVLSEGGAKIR